MNWQAVQEDLVVALVVALAGSNVAWLLNTIRKLKTDIDHAHRKLRESKNGSDVSANSGESRAETADRDGGS